MTATEPTKLPVSKLLIMVANYNQEIEIQPFLEELSKFVSVEQVIVVDDGSSDQSPNIAEKMGFTVIRHPANRGIGAMIRVAIEYGRARRYQSLVVMSANGKMRPEDLSSIVAPVLSGEADYSTGSRFLPGGASPGLSLFRRIAIPLFSLVSWPILGRLFSDITCGYRCYNLDFFDNPQLQIGQEWLNRYEMEYYIHYWACRLRLRIVEVPVVIIYSHLERGRESKINPSTDWWSMIKPFFLLTLRIRR